MPDFSGRATCRVGAHVQKRGNRIMDAAASGNTFPRMLMEPAFPHTFHCTPRLAKKDNDRTDYPWEGIIMDQAADSRTSRGKREVPRAAVPGGLR